MASEQGRAGWTGQTQIPVQDPNVPAQPTQFGKRPLAEVESRSVSELRPKSDLGASSGHVSTTQHEGFPLSAHMTRDFIHSLHKEIGLLIVTIADILKFNKLESEATRGEKLRRSFDVDAYHFQEKSGRKYLVFKIRSESENKKLAETMRNLRQVG